MNNIPTQMRALVLEAYDPDPDTALDNLRVGLRPVPKLKPSQVLVKMEAAPCNPSDLLFLQGRYGVVKSLPTVPGWEGAGTVVATGGWRGRGLVGRRVAVGGQSDQDGTWAEYFAAEAFGGCVPLRREVDLEQGSMLLVNPLTAVGLLAEARRRKAPAVLQTAAASQVGRMVIALAQATGMPLVSIVRRPEQVELLRRLGAKIILNSSEPYFQPQLEEICRHLKVTVAFDAVAGALTGQLLAALGKGGVVFVYGSLAQERCGEISPLDLVFRDKQVTGFFLGRWLRRRGLPTVLREANRVQKLIAGGQFQSTIQRRAGLAEAVEALRQYKDHMTAGKVLIKPGA